MKTYAILVSLIVVGLALSLVSQSLPSNHRLEPWLMQLASILLIGSVLGLIDKTLLTRDHIGQIRKLFRIHESITEFGLKEIMMDANHYQYGDMIRESPTMAMVLNDGRTWTSARISDFKHRFAQYGFLTEFFVPDPASQSSALVGKKTGYTADEQADKINQATKRLIKEFELAGKKGSLKIYHIPYFPTHSVFLGAQEGIISLYGVSSPRRVVPVFAFRKTSGKHSLYVDVADDVEDLRRESCCVYGSAVPSRNDAQQVDDNGKAL